MMNVVVISGRLTADPKFQPGKDGDSNKDRASFHVAVNDVYSKEERADFVPCVAWGVNAKNISQYCKKGKEVTVKGHLRTNTVEKDGVKQYFWEVVVEAIQFGADAKNQKTVTAPEPTAAAPADSDALNALAAAVIAQMQKTQQTQQGTPAPAPKADHFPDTTVRA